MGLFGGFTFFAAEARPLAEAKIIPVDILTVAPETNVSAAIKRPKAVVVPPEPEPEIMTTPTPMENAEEVAPEVKVAVKEDIPEPEPEIIPEKTEEVAEVIPEPEPDPEPEPKEPTFDLDALSGLIDLSRETAPEANQQVALASETAQARFEDIARRAEGEGSGLSATEADLVANAMQKCWRMPAAATDAENLRVRLNVKFVIGGHVESVTLIDQAASHRLSPGNAYWGIAEREAIAAVNKCSPYDFLPNERYGVWRELILNLRPQL